MAAAAGSTVETEGREMCINDITSLKLTNVLLGGTDNDITGIPLRFERQELPIDFVQDIMELWQGVRPQRPMHQAPATEDIELDVKLSRRLRTGSNGLIYEVDTVRETQAKDGQPIRISPLICKISPHRRNKPIAREAWFYAEMQTLQGVIIPRCFGFFVAKVPERIELIPRMEDVKLHTRERRDDSKAAMEGYYEKLGIGAFVENPANRELLTRLEDPRCVSVLLLERLGPPVIPRSGDFPPGIAEDVCVAYKKLCKFGVEHNNVERRNLRAVLHPATRTTGTSGLDKTPACSCRIIDFEMSVRNAARPGSLMSKADSGLWYLGIEKKIDDAVDL